MALLIACPSCSCHAFARETHCPGCGALLRAPDGSLQRTAAAAFLGLTMAVAVGCSGETGSSTTGLQTMSTYGTAVSSGETSGNPVSSASSGGMGGYQTMSTYGVGTSSGNGAGGAGGAGGNK